MVYFKTKLFVFFACLFLSANAFAQEGKEVIKVLFVGNSFTFYYNLPQVLEAMSEFSESTQIEALHSLVSGSTLLDHLNQDKGTKTIEILNTHSFDYVVINHHSLAALDGADTFFQTSKKMVDLIRSKNASPIFMMTWGYKSNPLMIDSISKAYNAMGSQLDVDIVPCGLLFSEARKLRPDLTLFDDDDKHPSKNATYLNGLAFYKYFTNEKTYNIPKRLSTLDPNRQKLYLLFLSQKNSFFLQNLVENFNFKTRFKK
jgi:hypothetical protein